MTLAYSLGYLTVSDLEPSAQIYVAAAAGYDYVGLRPLPMGLPGEPHLDIAHDARLLADCRTALADTGIGVWDIELARVLDDTDFESYRPAMELGAALGARVLISSVWTADHSKQVDGLAQIAEMADAYGLTVVAEFVALSTVKTVAEMAGLITEVNATNLGMLVDVYHWFRAGSTPQEVAALPRTWLPMVHLCDLPAAAPRDEEALRVEVREARLHVGEGGAPIGDLVQALPDTCVMAIEQPHLERLRVLGDTEYATRCLRHARSVIEPLAS
ncbi:MAG: sugar phosphate isomerase/epimerase family protein [Propioniciclava sp.]